MRAHPRRAPRRQQPQHQHQHRGAPSICAQRTPPPPGSAPGEKAVCSGLTRGSAPSGALVVVGRGGPVIRQARACSEFSGVSSAVPAVPAAGEGGAARSRAEPGRGRSELKPQCLRREPSASRCKARGPGEQKRHRGEQAPVCSSPPRRKLRSQRKKV